MDEKAPFDDSRKALAFALENAEKATIPAPFMNKAMAEVKTDPRGKRPKRELQALHEAEDEMKRPPGMRGGPLAPRSLRGLEAAHQAGIILHHFGRANEMHQAVLRLRVGRATRPCACRSPCCRGWQYALPWIQDAEWMCQYLANRAEASRVPGKKGFSTHPALRREIVEDWARGHSRTLEESARWYELSTTTVARHRELLVTFLTAAEGEAWNEVNDIFDQAHITGSWD